ncbi:MAG: DUF1844 domain-containing protein [Acidobacteriota bacterium]
MEKDLKSIILLLTTQAMINLGEIEDPISKIKNKNRTNAELFISLLEVLDERTKGNLTEEEDNFLKEVLKNLASIYKKNFLNEDI